MNDDRKLPPRELLDVWLRLGRENHWIKRACDPPFDEDAFRHCDTRDELKAYLMGANWAVGTAFSYRDICFINQDEGGGEWLTIRHGVAFESLTWHRIIESDEGAFDSMLDRLLQADEQNCRELTY